MATPVACSTTSLHARNHMQPKTQHPCILNQVRPPGISFPIAFSSIQHNRYFPGDVGVCVPKVVLAYGSLTGAKSHLATLSSLSASLTPNTSNVSLVKRTMASNTSDLAGPAKSMPSVADQPRNQSNKRSREAAASQFSKSRCVCAMLAIYFSNSSGNALERRPVRTAYSPTWAINVSTARQTGSFVHGIQEPLDELDAFGHAVDTAADVGRPSRSRGRTHRFRCDVHCTRLNGPAC